MDAINPQKTHVTATMAAAWTMAVALIAGTWVSAVKLTTIDRDIGEMKAQRVFTRAEITEMVDKRVDERWESRKSKVRMTCDAYPRRGEYTGCQEVTP